MYKARFPRLMYLLANYANNIEHLTSTRLRCLHDWRTWQVIRVILAVPLICVTFTDNPRERHLQWQIIVQVYRSDDMASNHQHQILAKYTSVVEMQFNGKKLQIHIHYILWITTKKCYTPFKYPVKISMKFRLKNIS